MNFFQALNLNDGTVVSFVGGGGKTTTMFAIAKEASSRGLKTVITTTTKIFYPDENDHKVILTEKSPSLLTEMKNNFKTTNEIVVGTSKTADNKLLGINESTMSLFFEAGADIVLCEADGSQGKSFKGEAQHEPVIPSHCDFIIHVIGIDCFNKPIQEEYVHRSEIITNLTNVSIGTLLNDQIISQVLLHSKGYIKSLTSDCEWVPFINKVDSHIRFRQAKKIADSIRKNSECKILIGAAINNNDPVIEIVH